MAFRCIQCTNRHKISPCVGLLTFFTFSFTFSSSSGPSFWRRLGEKFSAKVSWSSNYGNSVPKGVNRMQGKQNIPPIPSEVRSSRGGGMRFIPKEPFAPLYGHFNAIDSISVDECVKPYSLTLGYHARFKFLGIKRKIWAYVQMVSKIPQLGPLSSVSGAQI